MTEKQRRLREIRERISKTRQRMSELARKDELTAEERTEFDGLETGVADEERRARQAQREVDEESDAATTGTEQREDGEARELRELRSKVTVADAAVAAYEQRAADGALAELNAALGIAGGPGTFPTELLAAPEIREAEHRTTTDTDGQATQSGRWLDRLFADTAAMRIGVSFDSVSPGAASYPVTTAGADPAQKGRSEDAGDAAWTVSVTKLEPTANRARAVFSDVDECRLPGLQQALRRDLSKAMTEKLDRIIFLGDAGANEDAGDITGLIAVANVIEKTLTQANKVKHTNTLTAFIELLNGKGASGMGDLRIVASVAANALWYGQIVNSTTDNDLTMAKFLMENGLSWSVRGEIEDAATTANKWGAVVGLARGIEGAAVAAVWESSQLIVDPYSKSAQGKTALTLSTKWAFGVPRPTNFARLKFVA